MKRRRHEKGRHTHYCILVNRTASEYSQRHVKKLCERIRQKGGYYSVFEPESRTQMYQTAQRVCGLRRWPRAIPQQFARRGKVTSLIACGGDGTVNQVARVALKADLPLGILPMGNLNNIARSLCAGADADTAIDRITERHYRKIDTAAVAGQMFVAFAGIGFAPEMTELLAGRKPPRFCLGWSGLASKAASAVEVKKILIRIDAFRFEIHPTILNIHLLPYGFGLPLTPLSVPDDRTAEVIFNFGVDTEPFSTFIRQVCRRKYVYGNTVKLFRGKEIRLESVGRRKLCYDGEYMDLIGDSVDIKINAQQLKVFC